MGSLPPRARFFAAVATVLLLCCGSCGLRSDNIHDRTVSARSTVQAPGADTIIGKRHNVRVMAMSGNDYVRLGGGNDVAFGSTATTGCTATTAGTWSTAAPATTIRRAAAATTASMAGRRRRARRRRGRRPDLCRVRQRRRHRRRRQRRHLPRPRGRHRSSANRATTSRRHGRRRRRPLLLHHDQRRPGTRTADLHRQEGPARRHRAVRGRGQVAVRVKPSARGPQPAGLTAQRRTR